MKEGRGEKEERKCRKFKVSSFYIQNNFVFWFGKLSFFILKVYYVYGRQGGYSFHACQEAPTTFRFACSLSFLAHGTFTCYTSLSDKFCCCLCGFHMSFFHSKSERNVISLPKKEAKKKSPIPCFFIFFYLRIIFSYTCATISRCIKNPYVQFT